MGFSRFITSNEWEEYIKNPFNSGAREQYLQHVLVLRDPRKSKTKKLSPPYGLTFASFTTDVGVVEVKESGIKLMQAMSMHILLFQGLCTI